MDLAKYIRDIPQSTTTRAESNFFFNRGNQQYMSDTATFLQYQLEVERGNDDIAAVIRDNLFTQQLTDAVDAWEAMGEGPDVPATPLDPTIYQLEDYTMAEELNAQADQEFADARQADEAGDKFEFAVVFFAVSLFLAGIATLFKVPRVRVGLLVTSAVLLVPGIVAIVQGHSLA